MTVVGDVTETPTGADRSSAYAKVAALLHESRRAAPDQHGSFLGRRVAGFVMRDLSVYVSDYEQRHLVPIPGSAETRRPPRRPVPSTVSTRPRRYARLSHSVLDHYGS